MAQPNEFDRAQPQAKSTQPSATKQPPADMSMPKVTSVVPGILVPVDCDITRPFNAPRNRIERAKSVLEAVEFFRQGGIQGMLHLADLERKRILQDARRWEAVHGSEDDAATLQPDEADAMIDAMSVVAAPGVDYTTSTAEMLTLNFNRAVDKSDRRDTVRQLQRVVEDVMSHLQGYEGHMEGVKKRWTESLEQEGKRLEECFGPAEEGPTPASTTAAPTAAPTAEDEKDGDGDIAMA